MMPSDTGRSFIESSQPSHLRIAYFGRPHTGGTHSVFRFLREGLVQFGIEVRWVGIGAPGECPPQDREWKSELLNGELVEVDLTDKKQQAEALYRHICSEAYDGVIANILSSDVQTNIVRYLPPSIIRLLLVHTISPAAYRAAQAVRDHVHATVAVSPRIRQDLTKRWGFTPTTTKYIPNAVNLTRFRPPTRTIQPPFRIIFLGRLEDTSKGIFWLPAIMHALRDEPVEWTIAGDGSDRSELENQIKEVGVPVKLMGSVLAHAVPSLLAEHHIMLMPSRFEGFGLALIEAMAAGCVPVASHIHGVTDSIVAHGKSGLLFPIGDTRTASRQIQSLIRDPEYMAAMSHSATQVVYKKYDISTVAEQYTHLIRRVTEEPPDVALPLAFKDWAMPAGLKPGLHYYLPEWLKNVLRQGLERYYWR